MALERPADSLTSSRRREDLALPVADVPRAVPRPSLRHMLLGTWSGRVLVAGIAVKLVVALASQTVGRGTAVEVLDTAGSVALIVAVGAFIVKLVVLVKQRLLWRVRRRLILSYIF